MASDNAAPAVEAALLTFAQLVALLNVSRSSLERLRARDELPAALKVGGALRWRRAEVLAWIEAGCPAMSEWRARRRA